MNDTALSPTPELPSDVIATPIKPRRPKRLLLVLTGLLLVAGAAGAYFVYFKTEQPVALDPAIAKKAGQDVTFAPRFSTVTGYVKYRDAEWYSVPGAVIKIKTGSKPVYFSQSTGLPKGSATGLAVFHDKLWLSSQNGTAVLKADETGFTEVPVQGKSSFDAGAIQNGKVYHDALGDALYLSTFTSFYKYNEKTATWDQMTGTHPIDAQNVVGNKEFMVANANSVGAPVWVYSKKTGVWNQNRAAGTGDSFSFLFTMGEDLFYMARSEGYSGCSDAGKSAASVIYRLNATGAWEPLPKFNSDKTRPELILGHHIKSTQTTAYTSDCGDGAKAKIYDLKYDAGEISLTNQRDGFEGMGGFLGDDGEQQAVVNELSKATKLYPFTKVHAVDNSGNVIFGFSARADYSTATVEEGLAIAKGSDLTDSKTIEISGLKRYQTVLPVMCGGRLAYVFVGEPEASEGGPTYNWTSAKLLKVTGTKTSAFADLSTDVTRPVFACSVQKISWLGRDSVKQLDIATKQITKVGQPIGANLSMITGQAYALENGDLWLLNTPGFTASASPATLHYFDAAKGAVTKLAVIPNGPSIKSASAGHVWLASTSDSRQTTVAMYDKKGVKTYSKPYLPPVNVTATAGDTAVVYSGVKADDVFGAMKYWSLDITGKETAIPLDSVAMHSIWNTDDPGGSASGAVYDNQRKRVWFTDEYFGLFVVPAASK